MLSNRHVDKRARLLYPPASYRGLSPGTIYHRDGVANHGYPELQSPRLSYTIISQAQENKLCGMVSYVIGIAPSLYLGIICCCLHEHSRAASLIPFKFNDGKTPKDSKLTHAVSSYSNDNLKPYIHSHVETFPRLFAKDGCRLILLESRRVLFFFWFTNKLLSFCCDAR